MSAPPGDATQPAHSPRREVPALHRALLPTLAGLTAACLALAFCFSADEPWALRGDNKLIHFPMQLEAVRLWAAGRIPFFGDRLWMGYPLLANPETGALYLPRLIGYWLTDAPHLRAFDWGVAIHAGWLVAGTVAFLRSLGCDARSATFGGAMALIATQSVVMTSYLANFAGIAWWPWLLLGAQHLAAARERVLGPVLLASVPLAAQVVAGHPEVAFQGGCLAVAWILVAPGDLRLTSRLARVAALGVAAIALSGPQLFPTATLLGDTRRGAPESARTLLAIQGTLREVIDPRTAAYRTPFLGGATLLLGAVAIALRAPRAVDLGAIALIAGLASMGDATPVYDWLGALPGFELFRGPYKLFIISQFLLVWLAALGLQKLSERRPSLAVLGVALAALALLEFGVAFQSVLPHVAGPHTNMEAGLSRGIEEVSSVAERLTEPTNSGLPPRVFTGSNIVRMGGLPAVLGVELVRGGGVALLTPRHSWLSFGYLGPDHMNLLGVDLVLAQGACTEPSRLRYEPLETGDGVCVLDNPTPRPRYELVSSYQRVFNWQDLIDRARRQPSEPIGIMAPRASALPESGAPVDGTITVRSRAQGAISLAVTSETSALLLVRESWYAGWSATVDGKPAEIHPAGGLFFVVPVPTGEHDVDLTFRSPGFIAGVASAGLWGVLATFAVWRARRAPPPKAN